MMEHRFSILNCDIRVSTDCVELRAGLEDWARNLPSGQPASRSLAFCVSRKNDGSYVIREGDDPPVKCVDSEWMLVKLHHLVMRRVFADRRDTLMIHAGCGTWDGKTFILCGEKGAGKTTLLCRLLFDGVQGHSDDIVFLNGEGVVPFPGKFRVREGTLALVPRLKPACGRLVSYPGIPGDRIAFFEPRDAGFQRAISVGKVDLFVYLEPGRAEKAEFTPCPKFLMVQKIAALTLNFEKDPRPQLRTLCRAVNAGSCHTLRIQGLEHAVEMFKRALR